MNQHILGDKKKSNFDDNLANIVNEIYDKMPDVVVPEKKVIVPGSFYLDAFEDRYVFHNVEYNGKVVNVSWSKELLDEGRSHNLVKWINLGYKFQIPSADLYFASFLALYKNKDGIQAPFVESIRQMFAKDFKENFMMTSTKLLYTSRDKDKVFHNCGSPDFRELKVNFAGDSCYVHKNSGLEEQMNALLGSENLEEIENVFKWITGKKTYLHRINKPAINSDRAVVFGVYDIDSYFGIDADGGMGNYGPARGVVVVPKNSG